MKNKGMLLNNFASKFTLSVILATAITGCGKSDKLREAKEERIVDLKSSLEKKKAENEKLKETIAKLKAMKQNPTYAKPIKENRTNLVESDVNEIRKEIELKKSAAKLEKQWNDANEGKVAIDENLPQKARDFGEETKDVAKKTVNKHLPYNPKSGKSEQQQLFEGFKNMFKRPKTKKTTEKPGLSN